MSRVVYVNGQFLPEEAATVSIFDRGFLMADAVYEVSAVVDGKLVDNDGHLRRLERSLGELAMPLPLPPESPRSTPPTGRPPAPERCHRFPLAPSPRTRWETGTSVTRSPVPSR